VISVSAATLVTKVTPNHTEGAHSLFSVGTYGFCIVFLVIWLNLKESVKCLP